MQADATSPCLLIPLYPRRWHRSKTIAAASPLSSSLAAASSPMTDMHRVHGAPPLAFITRPDRCTGPLLVTLILSISQNSQNAERPCPPLSSSFSARETSCPSRRPCERRSSWSSASASSALSLCSTLVSLVEFVLNLPFFVRGWSAGRRRRACPCGSVRGVALSLVLTVVLVRACKAVATRKD
jgi:hypothetical protein